MPSRRPKADPHQISTPNVGKPTLDFIVRHPICISTNIGAHPTHNDCPGRRARTDTMQLGRIASCLNLPTQKPNTATTARSKRESATCRFTIRLLATSSLRRKRVGSNSRKSYEFSQRLSRFLDKDFPKHPVSDVCGANVVGGNELHQCWRGVPFRVQGLQSYRVAE